MFVWTFYGFGFMKVKQSYLVSVQNGVNICANAVVESQCSSVVNGEQGRIFRKHTNNTVGHSAVRRLNSNTLKIHSLTL